MASQQRSDDFVSQLTGCQSSLFAYILSLLPDVEAAQDVLQDANLVLWRKGDEYVPGTNFFAWAHEVTRYRVLSYLRDRGRDRHVFDAAFLEQLPEPQIPEIDNGSRMARYLEDCLQRRTAEERQLIEERYAPEASLKEMALRHKIPSGHLSVILCRIRQKVTDCVQRKLALEGQHDT
ncbi:MAG: sigma-70 family RNA polymerase sigma factor [Planctomycetes bacterium]|nr:sigma-70 family RNA polymerase sigma factor [Planctomycetota bacterium]